MKNTHFTAVALMAVGLVTGALGGIANAADLSLKARPAPSDFSPIPISTWTGIYVGLNGGGGWGTSSHTNLLGGGASGDFDVSGGLFGGTIGYNYQFSGPWVAGLEADLDWADINGTQAATRGFVSSHLDWLDTFRARLGYSFGPGLLYVTGGAAYGGVAAQAFGTGGLAGAGIVGGTETRFGWTIGAGYEYRFTPQLSGKLEYLYVDLGTDTQLLADNVKYNTNIFRGGLNWRF
jgi:outer membrane immunogenic protein